MEEYITVHGRIMRRHPEISPQDVGTAWGNRIATAQRRGKHADELVAVGFDAQGRMLEMVAVVQEDGVVLVFHAMTPPSAKTLKETNLVD